MDPRNLKTLTVLIIGLCLVPGTASANAGTPLMWFGLFYLAIGNAILGVIEGLLVSRWFGVGKGKSIALLIAANYLSSWIGAWLLLDHIVPQVGPTIETIGFWFWIFVLLAIAFTLLIEFPFHRLVLQGRTRPWYSALASTGAVHLLTYPLILFLFWSFSSASMMTQLDVVNPDELNLPKDHRMYWISPEGDAVFRSGIDGTEPERIAEVDAPRSKDGLVAHLEESESEAGLRLSLVSGSGEDVVRKIRKLAGESPIDPQVAEYGPNVWHSHRYHHPALRLTEDSDWEIRSRPAIIGDQISTGERFQFALETPFAAWHAVAATHLEGDLVIFQLGRDQICIIDPIRREIALIVQGKSPVVEVISASLPRDRSAPN